MVLKTVTTLERVAIGNCAFFKLGFYTVCLQVDVRKDGFEDNGRRSGILLQPTFKSKDALGKERSLRHVAKL